jgi:hypothetical protein
MKIYTYSYWQYLIATTIKYARIAFKERRAGIRLQIIIAM